jgi:hypothetical protein
MVNALNTVDGIGLGRTITEQVTLCRELLKSRTPGARDQALDMNDFGLTSLISMSQMKQLGDDAHPIDMSKPDNVLAFRKDMAVWVKEMQADQDKKEKYGGVVITSAPPTPYTDPYTSKI